ncbi:MAG: hypothetical protein HY243_12725 [Proteobacteria bacterium]|nr:hypothetical protein [Pseudomonadota bacterium]
MRRLPSIVLAFIALINLVRGSIHAFAPDGGAHSIAGLDLSSNAQTILNLFAALGLQQIVLGLFEIYILLRRRDLVWLALALQTAQTAVGVANLYLWRTMPVHVPGEKFNAALLVVLVAALGVALMQRRAMQN